MLCAFAGVGITTQGEGTAASCASEYIVQSGDSWGSVSHATGIYIRPLAAANGMTRQDTLHPGMVLCVPAATSGNSPSPSDAATSTSGSSGSSSSSGSRVGSGSGSARPTTSCRVGRYTVRAGDSWSAIAASLGTSLGALLDANDASADTTIHPGDSICTASATPRATGRTRATRTAATASAADCADVVVSKSRVLCMDLSAHKAWIGVGGQVAHTFQAVAGYGRPEDCEHTYAGHYTIVNKQERTPQKGLHWGMSFGGGCTGDQIVHATSSATMGSAHGTDGCIGLLEVDAATAYQVMQLGDPVVIVE